MICHIFQIENNCQSVKTAQRKFEPRGGQKTSEHLMILLESSDPAESEAVIQLRRPQYSLFSKAFLSCVSILYNQKNTDLCHREIKDD